MCAMCAMNPSKTALIEQRIETGLASPLCQPPYRVPCAQRDAVLKELQEMEARGLIEPSLSGWSAPIVAVGIKDGSLWLCVDYRQLNSVTWADPYPMLRIDELLDGTVYYHPGFNPGLLAGACRRRVTA